MEKGFSPFGYTHPDKPLESMCRYCKNEDTTLIPPKSIDAIEYAKYYGHTNFYLYSCHCCNAICHGTNK